MQKKHHKRAKRYEFRGKVPLAGGCFIGYTEKKDKAEGRGAMPWYWFLIIVSAVVGPFETYYVISRALERKRKREEKEKAAKKETENKTSL